MVLENFDSPFDYVHRIVVDPTNGNVYAAAGNNISRSTDGGTTWTTVLGTSTASTAFTDIIVTPTGRLYASFVGTSTSEGVWTSTTGASGAWTKIAGTISAILTPATWNAPSGYGRVVMAYAPSNPDVVFFLYWNNTTSNCAGVAAPEAKLFKYVQSTGTFTDLSANLPNEAGCLNGNDPFAVQGGYDLLVAVKPDDENTVFVGGTNLYRSTSGFTNTTATKRIGGYNSPADYNLYPNHHPDQHIAIFASGDNNTIYSGNDGGIHKADATASTVVWTSLNNNYVTYQYYHVDIDPANGSAALMGGAQDNGTTTVQSGSNFSSVFGGDGCGTAIISYTNSTTFNAIASSQSGNLVRLTGPSLGFTITPTGLASSAFVTYFNLDQDNTNYLYFAGNTVLYRTRIARTISGGSVSGSATGWEIVPAGITGTIQCMSTSRNNTYAGAAYTATNANRKLYIGTTSSKVYRLSDPAFTVSAAVDITPVGAAGVCSSISINPDDDNEVIATFANYGVNSVYHTLNANAAVPTWTVVEGPANGAVALGSARSSIITKIGSTKTYFVGSSTGLYSTQAITGATTVWDRVGTNEINYAVCSSMRLRVSDNRIVVGTHGNGMFELQLTVPPLISTQPVASTVCADANTSFSIVSANATSYKWQISNDNISANFVDLTIAAPYTLTNSGATLNITGAVTGLNGKYFRCVAINVAGSTNSTGVLLTVNAIPTPTASSNSPICAGSTLNLSSSGGTSYAWTGVNSFTSNLQNPIITNATTSATGTYQIVVTNANGCTAMATTSATINAIPAATASSNTPVCLAATLTLTGGGGTSYSWIGVNSFTSSLQSPTIPNVSLLAAGTYRVVVTSNGCTATATTSVVINPLPTATASSNSPVCVGATLNLSSSGGVSYSWTGVNSFTSSLQSPTIPNVSSLATGTYKVVITNANGCTAMATTSATVNAIPTATVSSNTPICAGSTINLSSSGGGSYTWTGVNSFTSTLQNPTIPNATTLATGTYKVVVTNANGCTAMATTSATVNAIPTATASSNSPVCIGGTLSLAGGGGTSYAWTGVNSFTSTLQSPTIPIATSLASGTYQVVITNNGCTATATTSVIINPLPMATATNNTPVCSGGNVNLIGGGGVSYAWTGTNSFTSSLQNPIIPNATTLFTGTYQIFVTNANGCTATATTSVIVNSIPSTPTTQANTSIILGANISLSATGCTGVLKWYETISNNLVIMPVTPTVNTQYYAKCEVTENGIPCVGAKSNDVSVLISTTIVSAQTGDWESNSTWVGGQVPQFSDFVNINTNHIITINSIVPAKSIHYIGTGQIKFSSINAKLTLGF